MTIKANSFHYVKPFLVFKLKKTSDLRGKSRVWLVAIWRKRVDRRPCLRRPHPPPNVVSKHQRFQSHKLAGHDAVLTFGRRASATSNTPERPVLAQ